MWPQCNCSFVVTPSPQHDSTSPNIMICIFERRDAVNFPPTLLADSQRQKGLGHLSESKPGIAFNIFQVNKLQFFRSFPYFQKWLEQLISWLSPYWLRLLRFCFSWRWSEELSGYVCLWLVWSFLTPWALPVWLVPSGKVILAFSSSVLPTLMSCDAVINGQPLMTHPALVRQ